MIPSLSKESYYYSLLYRRISEYLTLYRDAIGAAGYFQDGRRRKARGAFDGYLERPRGIRDILTFQRPGFWYRGAHLLSLQSLVQSFQRREQQVSRTCNKFSSLLSRRDFTDNPASKSCRRRFPEIYIKNA